MIKLHAIDSGSSLILEHLLSYSTAVCLACCLCEEGRYVVYVHEANSYLVDMSLCFQQS
jgi:hypothetical protein